eukprot:TRINITY_DN8731_c0_g1_i1.p1 TRINITY_DN8731_c0_g1~~TRINITY_DN8731_c0_g1_i1.p1  ORF type:complete len:287 (-),score=61.11 TRINITY_DN8731_c0_g1_i1:86-946(-)
MEYYHGDEEFASFGPETSPILNTAFFVPGVGTASAGAAGGALGGGLAYAMCKKNCPGAEKGFANNLPGISALRNMLGDDDAEERMREAAEEEGNSDIKSLKFLETENSACRLNCKIKSLMAAAAAAGATGLGASAVSKHRAAGGSMMPGMPNLMPGMGGGGMPGGGMAGGGMAGGGLGVGGMAAPLDEWNTGPVFAFLGCHDDRTQPRKLGPRCRADSINFFAAEEPDLARARADPKLLPTAPSDQQSVVEAETYADAVFSRDTFITFVSKSCLAEQEEFAESRWL